MNRKEDIEDQVYKNKRTLKVVMMKYAIDNRFQCKTKRSSLVRYFVFKYILDFVVILIIPYNIMS